MTVFENSLWPIWENGNFKSGDNCKLALFKKDTIVINQSVLDGQKNRGEENFVVAHEASHWIKDKEYFMGNPDNVFQVCSKNSFNQTNWTAEMKELDIIECQTNYMAAAILMPRDILKAEFFRLLRFKNIPQSPLQLQRFMFGTIQKLSKIFNVNFNPVKYRLMDIGVLER